jgi:hypothetical protein
LSSVSAERRDRNGVFDEEPPRHSGQRIKASGQPCGRESSGSLVCVLIRVDHCGALAIGQLSHAWLSGQLARAWGNDRFSAPEPREEVVLGAQQHDIGWALFDLEPRFNPETGLPRNFLELTVEEHLAIWRGAPDHLLSQSLHAALVVSLHGASLSELRAQSAPEPVAALRAHIDDERARQVRLCATLGVSEARAQRTRRQMWTWDSLSLALCNGWRPFTARDVPTRDGLIDVELRDREDGACTLDPWPFATERVSVRCEARRLGARFEDDVAMRRAFEHPEPVTLTFTLVTP